MNFVYEVTDALHKSSSSLKSSVTDVGYSFFAVLRQNVRHCCPLVLVGRPHTGMRQDMMSAT
jgi:hypothetical protein